MPKSPLWRFHHPKCTLYICRENNEYFVVHENMYYGAYISAEAAADDVFTQTTGCNEWDLSKIPDEEIPRDLDDWERIQ